MKFLLRIALAAALMQFAPAFAQAPKKAAAPAALQKEFDGFIEKFRAAVKANDSAAVAGMARMPFAYALASDGLFRDAAQFRAKAYPHAFTPKNRACIQSSKASYDPDKGNNYFIFCGNLIFTFTRTPAGFLFTDIDEND